MRRLTIDKRGTAVAVVLTGALVLAGSTSASAHPSSRDAAETARLVERAAGVQRTTDTADASAPSSTVVAPALGSAPVELRTSNGASLEIRLPDTTALSTAQRVAGSATVYDGPGAVDVAVKPLADGVRIATVLDNASAPTEYAYDFGQLTPVVKADGSVTISYSTPDFLAEVGTVSAPWARDAKGKAVPTHYVARGNTLVQVVDHTAGNFTYPIVADPTYGWGRYFYVFFNRAETATIASAGWGAAALTAACGFAGTAVGDPAGAAAGVALCGLIPDEGVVGV